MSSASPSATSAPVLSAADVWSVIGPDIGDGAYAGGTTAVVELQGDPSHYPEPPAATPRSNVDVTDTASHRHEDEDESLEESMPPAGGGSQR